MKIIKNTSTTRISMLAIGIEVLLASAVPHRALSGDLSLGPAQDEMRDVRDQLQRSPPMHQLESTPSRSGHQEHAPSHVGDKQRVEKEPETPSAKP
jgi:hypothetical protein